MGETGFCKNLRFLHKSATPKSLDLQSEPKISENLQKSAKMCVPDPVSPFCCLPFARPEHGFISRCETFSGEFLFCKHATLRTTINLLCAILGRFVDIFALPPPSHATVDEEMFSLRPCRSSSVIFLLILGREIWREFCAGFFLTRTIKAQTIRGKFRIIFREKICASKKIFLANFVLQNCHPKEMHDELGDFFTCSQHGKLTCMNSQIFMHALLTCLVAHDCGYPLSHYTCRATRVAADFLDL